MKATIKAPKLIARGGLLAAISIAALALAPAASTQAATITWGAAQNITGDSDVSLADSLVRAFNVGDTNVPSTTVNGVTFDPFPIPSQAPSVTVGNFTLATAATNGERGVGTGFAFGGAFGNLSASYQSLLGSAGAPVNGGFAMTLTISGLTVGQSYLFQWWTNYSGMASPTDTTTATAGNAITLDQNTSNGSGGLGQFAIGTFTADGSGSQSITFTAPSNTVPRLNGFQLRQVPEPSTWAMLSVGAGLLLAFRRRSAARVG